MNPVNESENTAVFQENIGKNKKSSGDWVTILSVATFILLAFGVIVFLYDQNQTLKEKLAGYQGVAGPVTSTEPSLTPSADLPTISSPSANSKVKSPLKVTGTVPAGWMFEGTFPVKLFDSDRKLIAQVGAKEVAPGSWQTGETVDFTATLTFKAATGSGTLVLENDNPSGDPVNTKIFEIPIVFQN